MDGSAKRITGCTRRIIRPCACRAKPQRADAARAMMPRVPRRGNIVTERGVRARDRETRAERTGRRRRGEKRNGRKGETAPERRITYREIWLERPRSRRTKRKRERRITTEKEAEGKRKRERDCASAHMYVPRVVYAYTIV